MLRVNTYSNHLNRTPLVESKEETTFAQRPSYNYKKIALVAFAALAVVGLGLYYCASFTQTEPERFTALTTSQPLSQIETCPAIDPSQQSSWDDAPQSFNATGKPTIEEINKRVWEIQRRLTKNVRHYNHDCVMSEYKSYCRDFHKAILQDDALVQQVRKSRVDPRSSRVDPWSWYSLT